MFFGQFQVHRLVFWGGECETGGWQTEQSRPTMLVSGDRMLAVFCSCVKRRCFLGEQVEMMWESSCAVQTGLMTPHMAAPLPDPP